MFLKLADFETILRNFTVDRKIQDLENYVRSLQNNKRTTRRNQSTMDVDSDDDDDDDDPMNATDFMDWLKNTF